MTGTRWIPQPPKGGQLPEATGAAHAPGLVIIKAAPMSHGMPRIRLSLPVPMRAAGPDPWPGGRGYGDTMSAFTASGLEAADLLARPGEAGGRCPDGLRARSARPPLSGAR